MTIKKALLVGINYKNTTGALNGCINDMKNIKDILSNNCGYNNDNIKVLTDETPVLPTRKNIEDSIKWLISNALKGDTLFFYYSGHGASIKDYSGDESDGNDEVIIPIDYQTCGIITDDWLFSNMITTIPAGVNLWCFTDCCHSGTMIDLKYNYKSACTLKKPQPITKTLQYKGEEWADNFSFSVERSKDVVGNICLFSGCQDIETSADAYIDNSYQGAFSSCFIKFIKNNLIKNLDGTFRFNGNVKLRNVLKEINARLDIAGFAQNSQLSVSKQENIETTLNF